MSNPFFDQPILNSPYARPARHWELDGSGQPTQVIVEVKGYRREDVVVKKLTMETYWVPGVNRAGKYGRWAFAEFTDVYEMQDDFAEKVQAEFDRMIAAAGVGA